MWDKLLPAIFGIIGTIVGASINGWITYRVANQRELIERERETRKHAAEVQQAARLIEMDLLRVENTVKRCIADKRWMYRDWPAFTMEGWEKYRDIIALELSHDDWLTVMIAVLSVDTLKTVRDIFYRNLDDSIANSYQFDDSTLKTLISPLEDIIAGRRALAPFVSGQSKGNLSPS